MLRPGFEPGICDLKGHNAWPDYAIVILWYDYYTTGASRMMYKSQYNTLRPKELDVFCFKFLNFITKSTCFHLIYIQKD